MQRRIILKQKVSQLEKVIQLIIGVQTNLYAEVDNLKKAIQPIIGLHDVSGWKPGLVYKFLSWLKDLREKTSFISGSVWTILAIISLLVIFVHLFLYQYKMTALVLFVLLNIFVCIIYKSPIMQSITNIVILLFIFVVVVIISIQLVIRVPLVFQHFTSYIRNSIIKQGGNEIEYQYMLGILTLWVLMVVYILCTMNQTFARFYKFLQAYVTSLILVYVYILLPSSIALFVIRFFEIVNPKNSDNINIFYITLAMLIVIPFSIIEAESRIKRCMQSFDRKWIYYKASNQLL
ncbi:MAG: hypothetical protein LN575_05080 [Rickettsia endosymbiont of Gnoriste bilineata]|nr:hypothetical protein [Rickettsia endosymbiont of Gnoriste bilineata]